MSSDDSSDSVADVDEQEWLQTLLKLRKRDPSIYLGTSTQLTKSTASRGVVSSTPRITCALSDEEDDGGEFLRVRVHAEDTNDGTSRKFPSDYLTEDEKSKYVNKMLTEFFGKEENLSEEDKFLKAYISTKGWIESPIGDPGLGRKMVEEDKYEDEEEDFEWTYNFRFEHDEANPIHHARSVPGVLRKVGKTRRKRSRENVERRQPHDVNSADIDFKVNRFKYTQVKANDFGMSVEEILTKDDKDLNRIVPMERISPYHRIPLS